MLVHAHEEFVERDMRIKNSSDYKININILGIYGEMHVQEFFNCIDRKFLWVHKNSFWEKG